MHALLIPLLAIQVGTSAAPSPSPESMHGVRGSVTDSTAMSPRPTLRPGARVRVHSPILGRGPVVGRAAGLKGDTLFFVPDSRPYVTMRVPLDDRARLDLSAAHHNLLVPGLLVGGLAGLGAGYWIVSAHQATHDAAEDLAAVITGPPRHEEVSRDPIYVGLAVGCVMGAVAGASMNGETWVPAQVPARIAIKISGGGAGVRLALSVSR